MLKDYGKKDISKSTIVKTQDPAKPKVGKKEGEIYEKDGMWMFNWNNGVCGYLTKKQAESGLEKLSGSTKEKS